VLRTDMMDSRTTIGKAPARRMPPAASAALCAPPRAARPAQEVGKVHVALAAARDAIDALEASQARARAVRRARGPSIAFDSVCRV
jgi:hypothetical protein